MVESFDYLIAWLLICRNLQLIGFDLHARSIVCIRIDHRKSQGLDVEATHTARLRNLKLDQLQSVFTQ